MKAKKSNAMFGVVLVLILGFAYFMNATDFLSKPLFPAKQEAPEAGAGPSSEQSKQMLEEKVKANRHPAMQGDPGDAPAAPEGIPSEPAIFKPKQESYAPTYNPTSTSSQWWDEDGYVDETGKKVKKDRGY